MVKWLNCRQNLFTYKNRRHGTGDMRYGQISIFGFHRTFVSTSEIIKATSQATKTKTKTKTNICRNKDVWDEQQQKQQMWSPIFLYLVFFLLIKPSITNVFKKKFVASCSVNERHDNSRAFYQLFWVSPNLQK